MPLYEYRCTECHHELEVLQKFSDKPLRRCEKCSGKLEKLISRTSFQLKGGGWYEHGYGSKSGSGGKPEVGDAASSSKTDDTASGKADSKSESKSEGKADSKSDDKPKTKKKSTKAS